MKMKLKHREFVTYLLADPRRVAGRAYAKAYNIDYDDVSKKASCDVMGCNLLKNIKVQELIEERTKAEEERIAKEYNITEDRVKLELASIGYANMQDYVEYDGDKVILTPSSELSRMDMNALKKVTQKSGKYGDDISIELHDKKGALVDLGKSLGMFKEQIQLDVADDLAEFFKMIDGTTRSPAEKMN